MQSQNITESHGTVTLTNFAVRLATCCGLESITREIYTSITVAIVCSNLVEYVL